MFHSHRNIKQRKFTMFLEVLKLAVKHMQKTERHCKNQCFCYHKTTKISPKTGPKTQKSASGPGHLRNRKKRCCKTKKLRSKVEKHGFFSLFACRFWTGAFTNRCLPYCFYPPSQCFLKASVTTYQKQEVLAEKSPPPGKPVTFTSAIRRFTPQHLRCGRIYFAILHKIQKSWPPWFAYLEDPPRRIESG